MTNYTLDEFKFLLKRCDSVHVILPDSDEEETIEVPKGRAFSQLKEKWLFRFFVSNDGRLTIGAGDHSSGRMYTNKVKEEKDKTLNLLLETYKNAMKSEYHHIKNGNMIVATQARAIADKALLDFKEEIYND